MPPIPMGIAKSSQWKVIPVLWKLGPCSAGTLVKAGAIIQYRSTKRIKIRPIARKLSNLVLDFMVLEIKNRKGTAKWNKTIP